MHHLKKHRLQTLNLVRWTLVRLSSIAALPTRFQCPWPSLPNDPGLSVRKTSQYCVLPTLVKPHKQESWSRLSAFETFDQAMPHVRLNLRLAPTADPSVRHAQHSQWALAGRRWRRRST